ncbi:MAG: hypothetical protein H7124_04705 [Phycisphaerales bacterium]|nr:hypothetical protein [Hyphomonadaceae bacterium]
MERKSLLAVILVASLAGAFWAALVFSVFMAAGALWQFPPLALQVFGVAFIYASVLIFIMTSSVGLAWHALAQQLRWRSFAVYAAAGLSAGLAIALTATSLLTLPALGDGLIIVWIGSSATIVSSTAWLLRRPDRDTPPNPPTSAP